MKKLTDEQRIAKENEKIENAIRRELAYWDNHFGIKETILEPNGKETVKHYPVTGKFAKDTNGNVNGVAFCWDANSYVVMVDSHKEIKRKVGDSRKMIVVGHVPFTKPYTRCKETSKLYYFRSRLNKATESENMAIASEVVTDMTIEQIYAKAPIAKGFAEVSPKNERLIECIAFANSKATTAFKSAQKAKARANAKANADAKASA